MSLPPANRVDHAIDFKSSKRVRLLFFIPAAVLIGVSVFFRLWRLGNIPGLNGDEALEGVNSLAIMHGHSVQWLEPNGNFVDVFHVFPLALLHAMFGTSIVVLRSVAAACELGAIAVNYVYCSRTFGRATALGSTLLIATLPEDIMQSRFAWPPAQSVLFDSLVLYYSVLVITEPKRSVRRLIVTVLWLLAAVFAHPTNLLMAVFPIIAVHQRWPGLCRLLYRVWPLKFRSVAFYGFIVSAVVLVLHKGSKFFQVALDQIFHSRNAQLFPLLYTHFFSGITAFRYVAGSCTADAMPDSVRLTIQYFTGAVVLIAVAEAMRTLHPKSVSLPQDRLLYGGWLASTVLFWLLADANGLLPGNERYGLCLIVPCAVAVTRAIQRAAALSPAAYATSASGGMIICSVLLAAFYVNYFRYIEVTGGNAQMGFRTAATDPKLSAWRFIRASAPVGAPLTIGSSTWWNSEPLVYFSATDPSVTVQDMPELDDSHQSAARLTNGGDYWVVDFANDENMQMLKYLVQEYGVPVKEYDFPDYAGRQTVDVIHINPRHR